MQSGFEHLILRLFNSMSNLNRNLLTEGLFLVRHFFGSWTCTKEFPFLVIILFRIGITADIKICGSGWIFGFSLSPTRLKSILSSIVDPHKGNSPVPFNKKQCVSFKDLILFTPSIIMRIKRTSLSVSLRPQIYSTSLKSIVCDTVAIAKLVSDGSKKDVDLLTVISSP